MDEITVLTMDPWGVLPEPPIQTPNEEEKMYYDIKANYWDALPLELKYMIVNLAIDQWIAVGRDVVRPIRKRMQTAFMSFGRCTCCREEDDCQDGHHPRKVLINWRYKVSVSLCLKECEV